LIFLRFDRPAEAVEAFAKTLSMEPTEMLGKAARKGLEAARAAV